MDVGHAVPGYTLVRRLDDSGAQATVHLGRQRDAPHREVAIKIYHTVLRTPRDRSRFQREVEALDRLVGDPHIVEVVDSGVLPSGQPFLAMQLCPGGSLASLLVERGPLSVGAVVDLGVTLADALGRAHTAGVLHRDVKPHNILLTANGSPVIADFGIAALQHSDRDPSATIGRWTASYAAPELFRGETATARSDVYGLAATLYALLAGHPPHHPNWRVPSPAELLWLRSQPIEDIAGVPEALMAVLRRALAAEPKDRYATAAALAAALHAAASYAVAAPVPDPPASKAEPVDSPRPGASGRRRAPESPRTAAADREARPDSPPVAADDAEASGAGADWYDAAFERVTRRRSDPTSSEPSWMSHINPQRRTTLWPAAQPLLAGGTAIAAIAVTAAGSALLNQPLGLVAAWTATLIGLTVAVAVGRRVLGFIGFAANFALLIAVAAGGYADSPGLALLWMLGACGTAIAAGTWAWGSQVLRLRWFALIRRVRGRRWWGQASSRSELTDLAALPAARFIRLASGTCHYAVVCGTQVALIRWASWPDGEYALTDGQVRRDGTQWPRGGLDLERARTGLDLLRQLGVDDSVRRKVFIAVDTDGRLPRRDLTGELTVCRTGDLTEVLGRWLAEDPYTLDLELLSILWPAAEK